MTKICRHHHHKKAKTGPIIKEMMEAFYICHMHSEIRQKGPGECPICGMALEPEKATISTKENPELIDFRHRFWIGLLLTIPVVILEMGGHFFNLEKVISSTLSNWIQLILSIPVVLWAGFPFFKRGIKSIKQKAMNMFTLISMGTGVTLSYSIIAVIFSNLFPTSFRNLDGTVPVYFEVASVIIILVLLGEMLELKTRERTTGAIKALLELTPKTAYRITKDGDEEVNIEDIQSRDRLGICPGDKIPLDMVAKAQRSRAPIKRIADVVSGWFVPVVILIAIIAFIAWAFLAKSQGLSYGLIAAVSVLIIACPCALGLATPMSIMVGVGKGAQNGILIKNVHSLEILEKVNTLILDKTGTLTERQPNLTKIYTIEGVDQKEVLQFTASLEQRSEHPLGLAIVKKAKEEKITMLDVQKFKAITGKGIKGEIKNKQIALGNNELMKILKIDINNLKLESDIMRKKAATVMFVAIANKAIGFIAVSNPIKKSTKNTLKELKASDIKIIMLTGDNEITAKVVATKLDIETYYADVLPAGKHRIVEEYLSKKGAIVAMAGDGINDASALAAAHVGIAMGTGTDIAIESAGLTLLKGDLSNILRAIKLSRAVMSNIRQNLFLAFFYNAAGIPIAGGILYLVFGILLSPILAAAAMSLSSLSVISNALRLNLKKI